MTDRRSIAADAVQQVKKDHGVATIMRLGDAPLADIEVIPTGSLLLDDALGIGGLPKGRIVEIFGGESAGKSTLTLHVIANAQKRGDGAVAIIDAEHAFDPHYAAALGVDVENLYVCQPDHGDQGLDVCETLVKSGGFDVIVVDSVAALVPKAELEGEMGEATMGVQARLMSQAMRKLTGVVAKSGTLVIFTNQIRMKIGVMFGSPETTTGGNALKFYASVRLDVRRIGVVKEGEQAIGIKTRIKVVKNKVSVPFKEAEVEIREGKGISRFGEILDLGVKKGIITKAGSHYSYDGEKMGNGKEAATDWLEAHPGAADAIENCIRTTVAT